MQRCMQVGFAKWRSETCRQIRRYMAATQGGTANECCRHNPRTGDQTKKRILESRTVGSALTSAQKVAGGDVPVGRQPRRRVRQLHLADARVDATVPPRPPGAVVVAVEAQAGEDEGALRYRPRKVIAQPVGQPHCVDEAEPAGQHAFVSERSALPATCRAAATGTVDA